MAHIIRQIDVLSRGEARVRQLCCMRDAVNNQKIYDTESILERIQKASMIKRLLEADTFERENKIKQTVQLNNN